MYSIFSFNHSPKTNKPLPSALKPVGKEQGISLAIEVILGTIFVGAGLYILLHHGVDISQIGTLGNKFGYLCLAAPIGTIGLDYLIGTSIKGVKNHNALKHSELSESQDEKSVKEEIDSFNETDNVQEKKGIKEEELKRKKDELIEEMKKLEEELNKVQNNRKWKNSFLETKKKSLLKAQKNIKQNEEIKKYEEIIKAHLKKEKELKEDLSLKKAEIENINSTIESLSSEKDTK